MSARTLVRLAIVLGVLVCLWGAVAVAHRTGGDVEQRWRQPAVTTSKVDTVVLAGARDTVVLARVAGDTWRVNGHPADPHMIGEMLKSLGDSETSGDVVARSAVSYPQLGVDSASGRHMRVISKGETLLDVVVGKPARVYGTGFMRPTTGSAVYLVRSALPRLAHQPVDEWRDPRIGGVPADSITRVEIERGRRRYILSRDGQRWALSPGGTVDSMAVVNLLGALADIRATGFATRVQADSVRFAPAGRRLRVLGPDGKPRLSLVFDSTASTVWVRAETGGTIWRVESWEADRLTPADSTLRARPAGHVAQGARRARPS